MQRAKLPAEDKVSLGDYGVFDSAVVEFGDGLIKAKAIDDRVGCAALLKLIEDEPPIDTLVLLHRAGGSRSARCGKHGICA